jgi:disulfide bond formation protein DsbB
MGDFIRLFLDRWRLTALVSSALMLAIAHGFETFGGLAPCTLCLRQREVYWVAATVALVGMAVVRLPRGRRWRWLFDAALALIFAVGMATAIYHAGAEWKFWPGPSTCSASGGGASASAMADLLNGAKIKPPACDKAAWVFLGISMAGWNALISLKLTVLSLMAMARERSKAR